MFRPDPTFFSQNSDPYPTQAPGLDPDPWFQDKLTDGAKKTLHGGVQLVSEGKEKVN